LLSEEDRATDTGNMYGEIWPCGFWDMRVDRQTNKQAHRRADHNTLHPYRGRNNQPLVHRIIILQSSRYIP